MKIAELWKGVRASLVRDADNSGYLLGVWIGGLSGTAVTVDDITNNLSTIDTVHHEVHEGETFQSCFVTGSVADNGLFEMVLSTTGTLKEGHLTWLQAYGGDSETYLYEGITGSAYGIPVTEPNMNRNSDETAEIEAFTGPTITALGTLLHCSFIPGGTGGNASGGQARQDTEWILRPGIRYLIRGIARTNTKIGSIVAQWYEEE